MSKILSTGKNRLKLVDIINKTSSKAVQTSITSHTSYYPNFFPDFLDSYDYNTDVNETSNQLFGLFPTDSLTSSNNDSYFVDYKSDSWNTVSSQLSAPLMYILCMFVLYLIIISVAFMSALYSHRKRIGYSYDESIDYASHSDEFESADEFQPLDPQNNSQKMKTASSENDGYIPLNKLSEMPSSDQTVYSQSSEQCCEADHTKKMDSVLASNKTTLNGEIITKLAKQISRHRIKKSQSNKLRKKRFRKIHHEKLAHLFLKKIVRFFPQNESSNGTSSTKMNVKEELALAYKLDSKISSNLQPLIETSVWNEENEL